MGSVLISQVEAWTFLFAAAKEKSSLTTKKK